MFWQGRPDRRGECDKTNTAHGCSRCVQGRCRPASHRSIKTDPLFTLLLMFFDKRRAGRKDCRKGQKQAGDGWSEPFCDKPSKERDETPKQKTHSILMRFNTFQNGEVYFDRHAVCLKQRNQMLSALTSHSGRSATV